MTVLRSYLNDAWVAGQGDGGFFDAGLAYTASPRAVFDIAGGIGWSEGYPDWSVTTGWTVLFSRP